MMIMPEVFVQKGLGGEGVLKAETGIRLKM